MKKNILIALVPALLVLSSCQAGPKVKEKEIMVEDTLAHEEIFGQGEAKMLDRGIRRLAPVDSAGPSIGIQTFDDGVNMNIRFVAAVKLTGSLAGSTAVWTRTMYEDDGDVYKVAAEKTSVKAYTSIKDGGSDLAIETFNESFEPHADYTHFVVYSMLNIPKAEYGNYYLNASLSINGAAAAKVVATSVNQNKQVSFAPAQEGYFLDGTIGGVPNTTLASVSPSGDDVARFSSALVANDAFYICYNHTDATPANSKFRIYDSSCIADENNPYLVDDGASSKMIKAVSGHNYAFNFTGSYELDDIEGGYTVQYTNNSEELVTVPLVYNGRDGSNKPQHTALISPKTGSALVFALDGDALIPSREDNANNNINNSRVVQCGGEDISLYVKDLGESHSLWVNYPGLKVFVNGNPAPLAPRANPRGNVAVYEVPLTAGQKVIINRGYNQLHLGDTEDVEFTAEKAATYAFYINNEYKVYTDELATVSFNIPYDTQNNGSLYAVGTFSGNWEPWDEYRLTWTDGNIWTGSFLLPVGKLVQLKHIENNGSTHNTETVTRTIVSGGMSVTGWNVA